MTREEFEQGLAALRDRHAATRPSPGCVEVKECSACIDCVFCSACVRCVRSRYSTDCHDSFALTHCTSCRASSSLAYCHECEACSESNYLTFCTGCVECDYCFGCVGLVRQEFHILNRKYSRAAFFKEVALLKKAFGLPA